MPPLFDESEAPEVLYGPPNGIQNAFQELAALCLPWIEMDGHAPSISVTINYHSPRLHILLPTVLAQRLHELPGCLSLELAPDIGRILHTVALNGSCTSRYSTC